MNGARGRDRVLVTALAVQAAALLALVFLPIGFDHPSSLGLDFSHALALGACHVVALLVGAWRSVARRRWALFGVQLAVPAALATLELSGAIAL